MRPDSLRTPLRADWEVAGHLTNTLWWPAANDAPRTVMLFIPGNPGLVNYYDEFLELVHRNALPDVEIFAVAHLGVSIGADPNALYSFQDQIDHKIECFDMLRRKHPADTQFVLMGHSIGAYLAVEVFKQRHNHNIHRLVALFPCLYDIGLTPNGIHFTRIFSKLPIGVVSTMASALGYVSPPILERLIALLTGQSGPSVKVTATLLNGPFVRSVLRMAQQEMEHVGQLDHDFYTTHLDKFIIYYSENDRWAPIEQYKYMKQAYPEHEHLYLCEEGLPHSFILDPAATRSMADKVGHWLNGSSKE